MEGGGREAEWSLQGERADEGRGGGL